MAFRGQIMICKSIVQLISSFYSNLIVAVKKTEHNESVSVGGFICDNPVSLLACH